MPEFDAIYLIHGDDHGRIGERRANLRRMAEIETGEGGVELLEGDRANVDETVAAVCAMSLTLGRRFVIVDGVERWKADETEPLEKLLASMPPDTTLAMFAREDGRQKVCKALLDAVTKSKGKVVAELAVKPWDLPKWARERGAELGLKLDPTAAKTLVAVVGERQQRLLRELEKLALSLEPGSSVDSETVIELCAGSAERKVWTLADSLIGGQTRKAVHSWLELEQQGERAGALVGVGGRRLRDAVAAAERLEAGEPPASIRGSLRMPPKAADQFLRDLQSTDSEALRDALVALAKLELTTRGGGLPMQESTAVARALAEMAD
ncbi:MAG: DNA polymerase III subunit delta [Actinomycetes bacterium]